MHCSSIYFKESHIQNTVYACKPVTVFLCVFLLLLVTGPGSAQAQCWTSSGCTGDTVPADDARDCCVGTEDGQSYGVGPEVEQCIGEPS